MPYVLQAHTIQQNHITSMYSYFVLYYMSPQFLFFLSEYKFRKIFTLKTFHFFCEHSRFYRKSLIKDYKACIQRNNFTKNFALPDSVGGVRWHCISNMLFLLFYVLSNFYYIDENIWKCIIVSLKIKKLVLKIQVLANYLCFLVGTLYFKLSLQYEN